MGHDPRGHKWLHYFAIYEELFASRGSATVKLLELRVYRGAWLELWHKYFQTRSTIVGIDIDETCQAYDRPEQVVQVGIGNQENGEFLKALIEEFGVFDVIIDHGSHMSVPRRRFNSSYRGRGSRHICPPRKKSGSGRIERRRLPFPCFPGISLRDFV